MPEEWFEVAYINFDKAILHGRVMEMVRPEEPALNRAFFRKERMIEQVLTEEEKNAIADLNVKHQDEMQELLKSFVESE